MLSLTNFLFISFLGLLPFNSDYIQNNLRPEPISPKVNLSLSESKTQNESRITTEVQSTNFIINNTLEVISVDSEAVVLLSRLPLNIQTRSSSSLSGDQVHQDEPSEERFRLIRELVNLEEQKAKNRFPNKTIYIYRVGNTGEELVRLGSLGYCRTRDAPSSLGLRVNNIIIIMSNIIDR